MTPRIESLGLVLALVLMSFMFQYQLKLLANEIAPVLSAGSATLSSRLAGLLPYLIAWRPVLIIMLAAALAVTWFIMLTRLDLSVALPIASIALVVNAVGAGLMLGEPLSLLRISGVVLVAIGIGMVLGS